jgi:hypothetical protein
MGVRPVEPGFSRVEIRPQPGNLDWAEMTLPTIRGSIEMRISQDTSRDSKSANRGKAYRLDVTIPANMTADIWLPNESGAMTRTTVGSGTHRFSWPAQ